jgi:DoxX-like family
VTTTPKILWTGRVLSALAALPLAFSGAMKLSGSPAVSEVFVGKFGYPTSTIVGIGVLELCCLVAFVIPRTAVLGATLLTGYLGGAIATHVRVGDNFVAPLVLGILIWAGLYLRDERVRALIPLRQPGA